MDSNPPTPCSGSGSQARRTIPAVLILLAICSLCYGSLLTSYFVSDDFDIIGRIDRDGFSTVLKRSPESFFRPVTDLSFYLDYTIWRFNPLGYRLTNLLLHAAVASAVFLLFRNLFGFLRIRNAPEAAFMSACVFASMESHSEAVSWITGRTDVLATGLGVAATACFVGLFGRKSRPLLASSLVLLFISFLAKESVLVLPAVWFALFAGSALIVRRSPGRQALVAVAGAVACLAAYMLLRRYMIGQFLGGYDQQLHLSFLRPWMLARALASGVRTLVPPVSAELFTALRSNVAVVLTASFAAVAGLLLLLRKRMRSLSLPAVALFVACFFVCMIPVVSMGVSFSDTGSERFMYLPGVFMAPALVVPLLSLPSSRRLALVLVSIVVVAEAAALLQVNRTWMAASRLTREIASELARVDLGNTVILNLPDNFRGAYVFRNGIDRAATIFQGRAWICEPPVICLHDVLSLEESYACSLSEGGATVTMPPGFRIRELEDSGFDVRVEGGLLTVMDRDSSSLEGKTIVSYRGAGSTPVLEILQE
jgi:hypothetical protein